MAIEVPVNLTHANAFYPTVYFSDVKGNVWSTGSDGEQYGIPEPKRELGMVVYFSSSQDFKYYKGNSTSSANWSSPLSWSMFGGGGTLESYNFTASFVNETSFNVAHGLGFKHVILQVFDNSDNQIIPSEIHLINENTASLVFSEPASGTVVATLGGATFSNLQVPGGPINSVQYNADGSNWGGDSKFTFDGTNVTIYDPTGTRIVFQTDTPIFNDSFVTQRTLLDNYYLNDLSDTGLLYTGTILSNVGKTTGGSPTLYPWDLAFLSGSDNFWYPVQGNNSSVDSRLLGICTPDGDIITEGYISVGETGSVGYGEMPLIYGTLEPGAPVYLSNTSNTGTFLTTVRPSNPGETVRIIGHLIREYSGGHVWTMYFRPDHTWVEIATP